MSFEYKRFLHRAAAFIGGFVGMYTLVINLNLGSAQTVNLLDMLKSLLGHDAREFLLRLLGAALYGGAIFTAAYLAKKDKDIKLLSMIICTIGFVVLGVLPENTDHCVALYPAFVMLPFVWVSFGEVDGFASSPIFSTNNYRQFIASLAEYCADHDKKHFVKAKVFAGTLVMFHTGAVAAYFACEYFGVKAAFLGAILCVLLAVVMFAHRLAENSLVCLRGGFAHKIK